MQDKREQVGWATVFIAAVFVLVAVTGLTMAFGAGDALKPLHEWVGVMLALTGGAHLLRKWPLLVQHFGRRTAWAGALAMLALCSVLVFNGVRQSASAGGDDEEQTQKRESFMPPPPPD